MVGTGLKDTVGVVGTGLKDVGGVVGTGAVDIAKGTAGVVGGIGKGALVGGKLIAGGGVDLVTGIGDFGMEQVNMLNQEIRTIHKLDKRKYSFIKSQDMFGHPI